MRFNTLSEWLEWQGGLRPAEIELGLDRATDVATRLVSKPRRTRVITVGGTNGKGSCVRYLESILQAAGYSVGAYTSPHLERYNERVRIDGREVDDATLCAAFERVDRAREDTGLTYFEFGTLAALDIFWRRQLDAVVLEVGLGGRLDTVNIVDADCAVITNVALDHLEWLGPDRESIGAEQAGIVRPDRPVICADPDPPASLLAHTRAVGAKLQLLGGDRNDSAGGSNAPPNDAIVSNEHTKWRFDKNWNRLPPLPNPGTHQYRNAVAALAALRSLGEWLPISAGAVRAGLAGARLAGRFEILHGQADTILDVAHNPDAARALAAGLNDRRRGQVLAVFGMMRDKAVAEVAAILTRQVDYWYLATLPGSRGLNADELRERMNGVATPTNSSLADSPREAWRRARSAARPGDMIVACGSFVTAGEVRAEEAGVETLS